MLVIVQHNWLSWQHSTLLEIKHTHTAPELTKTLRALCNFLFLFQKSKSIFVTLQWPFRHVQNFVRHIWQDSRATCKLAGVNYLAKNTFWTYQPLWWLHWQVYFARHCRFLWVLGTAHWVAVGWNCWILCHPSLCLLWCNACCFAMLFPPIKQSQSK